MSWTGFKKAVTRATTAVMMQAGAIEKTIDREYEEEEKRFEAKVEKLHKEAKGYLDAVRAMTLAQQRIADTINNFYEDGTALGNTALLYKTAVDKLDEEARVDLDESFRFTVLDPVGKLIATFPDFNESMKKRHKKLLDYDRARAGVKKLAEKPSEDTSKLPRAEQEALQAKEIYENLNNMLLHEIPKLIDLRVPYLDPSFEALVKSQLKFNDAAYKKFDNMKKGFENTGGYGSEGEVEQVLLKMRELSICSM